MASERTARRAAWAGLAAAATLLLAPLAVQAQSQPWWAPVAFAGHTVSAVRVESGQLAVDVAGLRQMQSGDAGTTWQPIFERHGLVAAPPAVGAWQVCDGRAGHVDAAGACHPDPGSPRLVAPTLAGHSPLAALPDGSGRLVAVDDQGVIWRRAADGGWARALLLLNQDALHGPPNVTGIAAFTAPLTDAAYLATDGYSVLLTTDGGDDWIRANPGLPDGVLAITTDDAHSAVYAATRDGLWVHHPQPTPAPPVYAPQDLTWRWLATAGVCVAAAAGAVGGMVRLLR
jgi:photosystem II stability/assembly factor-like uncharacterized protein